MTYTPDSLRVAFEGFDEPILPPGSMTPEPASRVAGRYADAWEFERDDKDGMVRQLEADREQIREYGEEIFALRKRLEEAEAYMRLIGHGEDWDALAGEEKP